MCVDISPGVSRSWQWIMSVHVHLSLSFLFSFHMREHTLNRHAVHCYLLLRQNVQALGEGTVVVDQLCTHMTKQYKKAISTCNDFDSAL